MERGSFRSNGFSRISMGRISLDCAEKIGVHPPNLCQPVFHSPGFERGSFGSNGFSRISMGADFIGLY
jgi:hypothetical protein